MSTYLVQNANKSLMGRDCSRYSANHKANAELIKQQKKDMVHVDTAAPAIEVLAECHIMSITSIDVMKQQFQAGFQLNMSWQDPEFCEWMEKSENKEKFCKSKQRHLFETCWHPKVKCINQVEQTFTDQWWRINGENVVNLKVISKGTFTAKFDLSNFVSLSH
jgi:hypothetical protein